MIAKPCKYKSVTLKLLQDTAESPVRPFLILLIYLFIYLLIYSGFKDFANGSSNNNYNNKIMGTRNIGRKSECTFIIPLQTRFEDGIQT